MQRERFSKFSDKINGKYKGLSFSCRLWVISTSEHSFNWLKIAGLNYFCLSKWFQFSKVFSRISSAFNIE